MVSRCRSRAGVAAYSSGRAAHGDDLDGPASARHSCLVVDHGPLSRPVSACRASYSGIKQMHSTAGGMSRGLLAADPVSDFDAGPPRVSFEFFPPKTPEMEERLWTAVKRLEPLRPRFVSVTYGAGGSTRERTHMTVRRIRDETMLEPAAHLTCVAA